jgi:hypothetical protein
VNERRAIMAMMKDEEEKREEGKMKLIADGL